MIDWITPSVQTPQLFGIGLGEREGGLEPAQRRLDLVRRRAAFRQRRCHAGANEARLRSDIGQRSPQRLIGILAPVFAGAAMGAPPRLGVAEGAGITVPEGDMMLDQGVAMRSRQPDDAAAVFLRLMLDEPAANDPPLVLRRGRERLCGDRRGDGETGEQESKDAQWLCRR